MSRVFGIGLLTCLLLFTSCQQRFGKNAALSLAGEPERNCKDYLKSIPTFWTVKNEGYYVFVPNSPTFYWDFVQNTNRCFAGFSVKKLKKTLGQPNEETPSAVTYYMTEACLTRNRDCNIQVFRIDRGFFSETRLIAPKPYGTGIN